MWKAKEALEVVDASLDAVSAVAREGRSWRRRELWEFMDVDESGGRRLFKKGMVGECVTVERILKGSKFVEEEEEEMRCEPPRPPLEADFFEESFDAKRRVLEEAPETETEEWCSASISDRDVASDVVQAQLVKALKENAGHIMRGMAHVRGVELNLSHASVQTANARRKLALARRDTVVDVLALLQLRRRRLRAAAVADVALAARKAVERREAARQAALDGDYELAVGLALDALDALESEPVCRLAALADARRDLAERRVPALGISLDEELWRLMDEDRVEVPRLAKLCRAAAALDEGFVARPDPSAAVADLADDYYAGPARRPRLFGVPPGLRGFGSRVGAYACFRLARVAAEVLVDADAGDRDRVVDALARSRDDPSHKLDVFAGTTARLEAPTFAIDMLKLCAAAVRSLDAVATARRWHDEIEVPTFDDDADDDDEEDEDASPSSPRRARRKTLVLRDLATRAALAASADATWRVASRVLVAGLRCASSLPRLEDLVVAQCAVACVRGFARAVVSEGADHAPGALREVGRAYLRATRANATSVLDSMLECEPWCAVRVDDDAEDAEDPFADPQICRAAARRLERLVATDLSRVARDRVSDLASLCASIRARLDPGHPLERRLALDGSVDTSAAAAAAEMSTFLDARADAALAAIFSPPEPASPPRKATSAFGVVTQAAYNGLWRATTKFAQIALLVEGAEDDVVDASLDICDSYARTLASTFVPARILRAYARGSGDAVLACDVATAGSLARLAARIAVLSNNRAEDTRDLDENEWRREATRRVVAAESLDFAAKRTRAALGAALDRATPGRRSAARRRCAEAVDAAAQLRGLVYRALGPELAGANAIVSAISAIPHVWAAATIQEENNSYVHDAATRFQALWATLARADLPGGDSSTTTREILWTETVQAAFEALVDGFAAVSHCSTEGRAIMSMDLQVLQFSLDKIHRARPSRGAVYADAYIKAFYFADDDLHAWISQNRDSYKPAHLAALAHAKFGAAHPYTIANATAFAAAAAAAGNPADAPASSNAAKPGTGAAARKKATQHLRGMLHRALQQQPPQPP
ncbi:hypothetical protein CTAYLR_000990 [Chrysophaeum taylorii]|uniref:Syndetin C-terminal domain-containing protein n=1 Tax=Chrysophaeum taylorii TaxID=2483200 RepID=A0AAD7UFE9_9STRA|nr:hypothetical protein CTAYLR_000990 [Chrysophaeum taylorii]